jgi:hypothetical protein
MAITPDTPLEAVPTPDAIEPLFKPLQYGNHELQTRIAYAPLTRNRAEVDGLQPDFAAQYYAGVQPSILWQKQWKCFLTES